MNKDDTIFISWVGIVFLILNIFVLYTDNKDFQKIETLYRIDMLQDCKSQQWAFDPPKRPTCEAMVDLLIKEAKTSKNLKEK